MKSPATFTLAKPPDPPSTITQGQTFVMSTRGDPGGCICPCCGSHRVVKEYRMSGELAKALARLHYLCTQYGSAHFTEWFRPTTYGMDVTLLKNFGLTYQPTDDPSKPFNKSGIWATTNLAKRWLAGKVKIPEYVMVDDATVIGQATKKISFQQACGMPWDPESAYA